CRGAAVLDAEEQQSKSHALKNWVSRLKDALYDADDLIDEFSYETLRTQVNAKGGRKTKQDTNFEENIGVIAIAGIGGLGKTTLAQSIYNDVMITKHFELKLWMCVYEDFDVKIIAEKILESATKKRCEPPEMDTLLSLLRKEIDGKKYLLIMDDVWNENYEKWVNLKMLLVGEATGSRILITTRSKQVAETFDVSFLYYLDFLNEHDSWLLFKKMTSLEGAEEELENSNLIKMGKEIVAKLKGVSLAIRTIGRLLYSKKSEVDWLSFKDNELSKATYPTRE
ncbi:putative disease resistance protein RGA3, partial [Momordica charantia]|uniref:Disease resistance protein RGA3 n=1 Tax=Momordica charantia TaxID=3673 RepID=A0A6J1DHP6_MOMCH